MDKSDLEQKIEQRKKQAEERGIQDKVMTVVKGLGMPFNDSSVDRIGRTEIKGFSYSEKELFVEYREEYHSGSDGGSGGWHVCLKYHDKNVFYAVNSDVDSYIPGDWERKLNELYKKALPAFEKRHEETRQREKSKTQSEIDQEAGKWGL